ncbi:MAG: hypothetical protein WCS37_17260 [Chloroflexota bacterium]|nr:hypothetical protein [Chloroflexota bacterium]
MYSTSDYGQPDSCRRAVVVARYNQSRPQAIAAVMPTPQSLLISLLSIINPLYIISIITVVVALVLILLGL